MAPNQTLYETLGVHQGATQEEIKKAHRKAMRVYHPDLYQGDPREGAQIASRLNDAFATLSNDGERKRYDAILRGETLPGESGGAGQGESEPFEDTWGAEEAWDVPLDEEVAEEEPAPAPSRNPKPKAQPTPAPPKPKDTSWQAQAETITADSIRFTTPLSKIRIPLLITLGGIAAGIILGLITDHTGITTTTALAVAGVVLGGVGTLFLRKKHAEPKAAPHPLGTAITMVVLALIALPVLLGFTAISAGLIAAVAAATGAALLTRTLGVRSKVERSVKSRDLRKNNLFGGLPGGVAPDLLDSTLAAFYAIPSVRIMRNPEPNGLFSHAVINGNKVAFIKAVSGYSGLYRWSGPSLLLERGSSAAPTMPEEVLRGPYSAFSARIADVLPKSVETSSWLFVYTSDGDRIVYPRDNGIGNPQVSAPDVGLDQVGRFLIDGNTENPTVDQETFLKAFTALLT